MLWTWTHNGFHGRTELTIRVPDGSKARDVVTVSDAVARRLNVAVCGSPTCRCGEAVVLHDYDRWHDLTLPASDEDQIGNYPQQP